MINKYVDLLVRKLSHSSLYASVLFFQSKLLNGLCRSIERMYCITDFPRQSNA